MKIVSYKAQGPRLYEAGRGLVPSVTEVLRVLEKRYLDSWRHRVGNLEADKVMRDAQVFGTRIHSIAEHVARDRKFKPLGDDTELQPFTDAIRDFLNMHIMDVLDTELEIASESQGFGGKLDLYGQMYDGSYVVVDWKTSAQLTREMGLQTAGYGLLLKERGYRVNKRIVVRVKKDAPGKFYARSFEDHEDDVKAFRAAVELWHWANRNKLLKALEMAG